VTASSSELIVRPYRAEDHAALAEIIWAAFAADELLGSTRSDVQHWITGMSADPARTLVATMNGNVAGAVTLPWEHLVVGHSFRRRGIGTRLVESAAALAKERGEDPIYLALPRDNPGAKAFYQALGWEYHHSLWSMRIENDVEVPPASFPSTVVRRPYRHDDIPRLTDLINTIFRDHPTPLTVTIEQLTFTHTNPAFNPESLYLLANAESPDELVGFCRVGFDPSDEDVKGWIPLIGIRREWRRHGLGSQLLRWGISYARKQGAAAVYLAVESENERALGVYESTGFRRVEEWPRYGRPENSQEIFSKTQ
jgi:mycothiol synthase